MSELAMDRVRYITGKETLPAGIREAKIAEDVNGLRRMFDEAKHPGDIYQTPGWRQTGTAISNEAVSIFLEELSRKYPYSGLDAIMGQPVVARYGGRYEMGMTPMDQVKYYKLYSLAPGIEQVAKAGITNIFRSMSAGHSCPINAFELLKRNFKKGKTLREITGLPSYVLASDFIRRIRTISEWNEFRVTVCKYADTKENFDALISMRDLQYGAWGTILRKLKGILNTGHYTLPSLLSYLDRLDIYQAIRTDDAIDLLSDYLSMCRQCEVEPRLDSNSLKREHDVMQRNFYSMRRKEDNSKFDSIVEDLKRFEYEEDEYIIVAPKSAEDLINEGVQQRNCVGSYINSVSAGRSIVMFMRSKRAPDRSLVTLELFPDTMAIRQARLACNNPVTSQKMNEFINRWVAKIQKENKTGKKQE